MEQKIGFCSTEQVTFVERKFAVSMRSLVSRSAELLGVPKRIKCGAAWGRKPLKEEAPALLPARPPARVRSHVCFIMPLLMG